MKGDLNYEFPKRKEPLCKSSSTPGSPGSTTAGPNHRLPFPITKVVQGTPREPGFENGDLVCVTRAEGCAVAHLVAREGVSRKPRLGSGSCRALKLERMLQFLAPGQWTWWNWKQEIAKQCVDSFLLTRIKSNNCILSKWNIILRGSFYLTAVFLAHFWGSEGSLAFVFVWMLLFLLFLFCTYQVRKSFPIPARPSSSSSFTEDSFELRVLLEPFSAETEMEGTSVNPTIPRGRRSGTFAPNSHFS